MSYHPPFDHDSTVYNVLNAYKREAEGKTFVITGPSVGGLGAGAAVALASGSPKSIILAGRSQSKIQPVVEELARKHPYVRVHFVHLDLADNQSVRSAAQEIKSITGQIHGLINSAGIMAPATFSTSKDGLEMQFASNHLGHFLLTNLVISEIKKAKGVVVNVSSAGYQVADPEFDDVNFNGGEDYNPWIAYGRSKAANILFTVALAKRLQGSDAAVFALNPGYVDATPLQKNSGVTPDDMIAGFKIAAERGIVAGEITPRTIEQGTATMVLAVLDPDLRDYSGTYLEYCQIADPKDYAKDATHAEKLWTISENLVKQRF